MAKRGKPLGNKRQREQAKRRKKREKEARREAHKHPGALSEDQELDSDGAGTQEPGDDPSPRQEGDSPANPDEPSDRDAD